MNAVAKAIVFACLTPGLSGCSEETPQANVACKPPTTVDSLFAEMARDTLDVFPPGGLRGRTLSKGHTVLFNGGTSSETSTYLVRARPIPSGVYRVGQKGEVAYRLRGWECDNITEWLRTLPRFSVHSSSDAWKALSEVANALNPIGDSVILRPHPVMNGSESGTQPGPPVADSIGSTPLGGRQGTVSVSWSNGGLHGLALATWTFEFDSGGRLVRLVERMDIGYPVRTRHLLP